MNVGKLSKIPTHPPRRSFYIGRWQPLHAGHVALIRTALDEGREVVIGLMDPPMSYRNPYTMAQRRGFYRATFTDELQDGRMTLLEMPWIDEVVYGRDCGWRCREIRLDEETEGISGTLERERA